MDSINITIVYASDHGSTRSLAESVARGTQSVSNTQVKLLEAGEATLADAQTCDALILGSSMRHRTMHHRLKRFIEEALEIAWLTDDMVGKVGAVFTVGGGHGNTGAGAELAQIGMLAAMAANGMLLVPLPKTTPGFDEAGLHWGPNGRTGGLKMEPHPLTEAALTLGFHHGANVARLTALVKGHADVWANGNVSPTPDVLAQFKSQST